MTRVKIELLKVECKDTEDVTGADEFYLVGALAGGKTTKAILTTPISINDGEVKTFNWDQSILFEGDVPAGQNIKDRKPHRVKVPKLLPLPSAFIDK